MLYMRELAAENEKIENHSSGGEKLPSVCEYWGDGNHQAAASFCPVMIRFKLKG
jgi:hypothetical protein